METLYKRIVDVFNDNKNVFTERDLPEVRQVDVYMGQPDDPESFDVFAPAIFLDWNIVATDKQPDEVTLDFHIIQEPGTSSDSNADNITMGLEYIQVLKACKFLLNKLRSSNSTPLRYRGERRNKTNYFAYHIVSYTCRLDEYVESIHRSDPVDSGLTAVKTGNARLKDRIKPKLEPEIETYN